MTNARDLRRLTLCIATLASANCGPQSHGATPQPVIGDKTADAGTVYSDDGGDDPPLGSGTSGNNCGQDPSVDSDKDGYTPAQGDCNDCDPLVNPGAMEVVGNNVDDNCDGTVDEPAVACDQSNAGKTDGPSLAQALEQCNSQFLESATLAGPSDVRARDVAGVFGMIAPKAGANMVVLSTGLAVDKSSSSFVEPQIGTNLNASNTNANPEPKLAGAAGCSQSQPKNVNDYTELVLKLKAPTNAKSFSFNFEFMSSEYPEFVCTDFNDEFLVEMQSANEYPKQQNISFDANKNPITVNSGFFTTCTNYSLNPETQHCVNPVSDLNGTGYEDMMADLLGKIPAGGSTGWLTTTAPVTPGEEITLHFIIFDEGDHQYDSTVLIDNLQWSLNAATAPMTIN